MGTIIDHQTFISHGWGTEYGALALAVTAGRTCLEEAGCPPNDLDLLVNAGLYHDRNLSEPALAALIQEDIGANIEDPHPDTHGTFSFDVANGVCGVLTGLQVADGFLRSGTIHRALVVASDADPGHGISPDFPFSAAGGALLCKWTDDDSGLGRIRWGNFFDGGESFRTTVGVEDGRNVLRVAQSDTMDEQFAVAAAKVARECLDIASVDLADIDLIVAAPPHPGFSAALASHLGFPAERISIATDERVHTAAIIGALHDAISAGRAVAGNKVLLIAAGAGITAGAVLYKMPGAGPAE
jgi:3-oxoacyl-[acyl-carrier-protein] synthase III